MMHPLLILAYRFLHPASAIASEARAVGAYNDAPNELKPQKLTELASYLLESSAFTRLDANRWVSRTGQVAVTRDDTGHGVTIYGGNVLGDTVLTPAQALQFMTTIVDSLPGDRRVTSKEAS